MGNIKCKHCGAEVETDYINSDELIKNHTCFTCNFWLEHLKADEQLAKEHKAFVCNGTHYIIGAEYPKGICFRGFGGAPVKVTFKDGTVVKSTNLWCQGDIPERFKEDFAKYEADLHWLSSDELFEERIANMSDDKLIDYLQRNRDNTLFTNHYQMAKKEYKKRFSKEFEFKFNS